jgi:cytochrome P450
VAFDLREEVSSTALRDDLLSMLVAGHETTASALTWTLYLLVTNPQTLAKAQAEVRITRGTVASDGAGPPWAARFGFQDGRID